MKHIFSGKTASSDEIRMNFPVEFLKIFTAGLDLDESQKNTMRYTIQNDVDLTKVWRVLNILKRIFNEVKINAPIIFIIVLIPHVLESKLVRETVL